MTHRRTFVSGLFLAAVLAPICAFAKVIEAFSPKVILGDGKDGRVFNKWSQALKERHIHKIRTKVYRKSGGDDCYVNLRFGDGDTFEKGRRVFLRTDKSVMVTWKVEQAPGGKPLVMNAYNGEVLLRFVDTHNE